MRIDKGYRPKYKSGLIGIRFVDNYHNIFKNSVSSVFINYFEGRYGIKLSDYRRGLDDFYIYFKCDMGSESTKIVEISNDSIVSAVDYVDIRSLETIDKLIEIGDEIENLVYTYSEQSLERSNSKINSIIDDLKKLL